MLLQQKQWNILETLWYTVYGLYHQLLDGIYVELVQAINYNIPVANKQVFDGIFHGIFDNRNELD